MPGKISLLHADVVALPFTAHNELFQNSRETQSTSGYI
jgi:hypothetical protein